eukprot:CAMPEP_0185174840 /NCGR_PEP_ID=MMETSP1139-20130426/25857_1 /TAXON_ID=298111 /ORGANISM="Pavlova sp., Strain CCMP459" /LENGTH=51 /DNA_ID=CAMNT_0027740569 /DNA_START=279 /DNA_END=431 /DNA_ORIENTATION=-
MREQFDALNVTRGGSVHESMHTAAKGGLRAPLTRWRGDACLVWLVRRSRGV